VLRQPSVLDPWYAPAPATPAPASPGDDPLRVAAVTGAHPDVAAGVRRAADALANAGYEVEELQPPAVDDAVATWLTLVGQEIRGLWPVLEAVASPGSLAFLTAALEVGPPPAPEAYAGALVARHAIARAWAAFQQDHPLVLGPVSTAPPFAAGDDVGGTGPVARILGSLHLTLAVSALGLPAVAVPVGMANGLPQGVQLIGPRWREDLCLTAAEVVEEPVTPIDPRTAPASTRP
jgi:amidase